MANFKQTQGNETVSPVYFVRVLNIPPINPSTHSVESVYFTNYTENLQWIDESGQSVTYYAIGMNIQAAEKSKEEQSNQCQITLDNVPQEFSALAQYYKLNGVFCQVYKAFLNTLSAGESGAISIFEGKIRAVTISQTQIEMVISNGYDGMDKVPRRLCWKSLFPYIPSAKDPRELVIIKR